MPDEAPQTEAPAENQEVKPDVEKEAFLERLNKESAKTKEAATKAATLERELADLRTKMEEREHADLPELERERKRAEGLEKKFAEAEQRAQQVESRAARMQAQQWVTNAASRLDFIDPDDAATFVKLEDIEDATSAERAVKALAKQKAHLVKQEDPKLPGRVLQDGRTPENGDKRRDSATSVESDATAVGQALQEFLANRSSGFGDE